MKEEGLNWNVSNVATDAQKLRQSLFIFCCAAAAAALADYYFHPPPAGCPIPSGRTHGRTRGGKADLDIGPIPDNQTRTSAALLTEVYF